ncbi:MAG: UPF0755 protein [Cyclobacteriaceae bacterium]|jgi:UPF0755 protein
MDKRNFIAGSIIVVSVMMSSFAFYFWQILFNPNVLMEQPDQTIAIPKEATFKEVQNMLYDNRIVNDLVSFSFLAKLKNYDSNIKPGVYALKSNMTNIEAINLLRSGAQTPIKITFTNVRKLDELPERIAQFMEFETEELKALMLNDTTAAYYGFSPETFLSMFIPNTYEVYWTDTPKKMLDRLKNEYDKFWTSERIELARSIGMTANEVSTLASIVQAEDTQMKESGRIAGVYVNRLRRGIPLQADPTVVYAVGDFSIRRVLTTHTKTKSPYNTYANKGLPPGPINMPSIAALQSVLNFENHNYLYFCAKADFSGYHTFATNLQAHNKNARDFQRAMDSQRIFK